MSLGSISYEGEDGQDFCFFREGILLLQTIVFTDHLWKVIHGEGKNICASFSYESVETQCGTPENGANRITSRYPFLPHYFFVGFSEMSRLTTRAEDGVEPLDASLQITSQIHLLASVLIGSAGSEGCLLPQVATVRLVHITLIFLATLLAASLFPGSVSGVCLDI